MLYKQNIVRGSGDGNAKFLKTGNGVSETGEMEGKYWGKAGNTHYITEKSEKIPRDHSANKAFIMM